jgi:thioester reductase-like protein
VRAAFAQRLGLPNVDPDVPLARLGLDSLGCVELAADLEIALGVRVPVDAVTESATLRSLCRAIIAPGDRSSGFELMRADAVLPQDICRPAGRTFRFAAAVARAIGPGPGGSLTAARHVLLTGATGFLGSEVLDRLRSRTNARITCLAHRRIPLRDGRVDFVAGDLTQPHAGLSDADWKQLAASVDCICHSGASINWVGSYQALRAVNVLGTRELLRLAFEAAAAFHFISSISVCYGSNQRLVNESFDALEEIESLHFGYAHTKAVAESLVREAAERGLHARIYRPSFISGDSRTGRFNPDDMLTALIAGSIRMGAAPDLDWQLDALPVNTVADLIVGLSATPAPTFHLVHPRPRHWRECVLWMRLYGYDVRLMPYREWTARLREEAASPGHPLRPLRSFFLDEHENGLTIPELHEETRRSRLDAGRSAALISTLEVDVAPLDAELLDTYFAAFIRRGKIPEPGAVNRRIGSEGRESRALALSRELLTQAGHHISDVAVSPLTTSDSIISELTSWHSGTAIGLFDVRANGRKYVLKIKPHSDAADAVGQSLAGICGRELADAYSRYGRHLGIDRGHEREIAIYASADPDVRRYLPGVIATRADAGTRTWAVLLERIEDGILMDTADRPEHWTRDHVEAAVDGMAALHAAWHRRVHELREAPWLGQVRTASSMQAMSRLWHALASHAEPAFRAWAGARLPALHREVIDRIPEWRRALDEIPQTLVHNDFNPRNVCLRDRGARFTLCAFDWELATIGAPVRDLAEFLCFVLTPDVNREMVDALVERHRCAFVAGTRVTVDRESWRAAFAAALCELLVDRLSVYAMVHRVKAQRFLPRVLRSWFALYAMSHDLSRKP